MKILVGICCGGTIHAQTVVSLVGALDKLKAEGDIDYKLSIQIGGDKPHAMNVLAREALDGGFDFLMSIDNDMIFPSDGIIRLLDSDKDIIGANYSVRGNSVIGNPREAVIKMADQNGNKISLTVDQLPKHTFRCFALGNGFTLYKTRVFKEIPAPWFENIEDQHGNWSTEDVNFHEKAQKNGFEVWCNPKIEMGHIGTYRY